MSKMVTNQKKKLINIQILKGNYTLNSNVYELKNIGNS